jgi:hypothetical protein
VIASLRKVLPAFGWSLFAHPHVLVKPEISRFHPNSHIAEFSDGSASFDLDVIFFRRELGLQKLRFRVLPFKVPYQHVFYIEDPTLSFVRMVHGFNQ